MSRGYVVDTQRRPAVFERQVVSGPADAYTAIGPLLTDSDRERFYVILLNTKHHIIGIDLISIGSLSASLVHPREVFKPAILVSAAALVAAHNHPSGDPEPSHEDIEFTRRLARCGELLGIRVLDHVIVGAVDYVSLKERRVL
jgi:DNA repair protein RadC